MNKGFNALMLLFSTKAFSGAILQSGALYQDVKLSSTPCNNPHPILTNCS